MEEYIDYNRWYSYWLDIKYRINQTIFELCFLRYIPKKEYVNADHDD